MLYNATKELYEPHKPTDVRHCPRHKLTIDESQEIQTMSVEVKNYYQESAVQFITGAMDLDKDWDTYVKVWKIWGWAGYWKYTRQHMTEYINN